jgi:hypothetical protein
MLSPGKDENGDILKPVHGFVYGHSKSPKHDRNQPGMVKETVSHMKQTTAFKGFRRAHNFGIVWPNLSPAEELIGNLPAYTGTYNQVEKFARKGLAFEMEFSLYPSHQLLNDDKCSHPLDTSAIFMNHLVLAQRRPRRNVSRARLPMESNLSPRFLCPAIRVPGMFNRS